MIRLADEGKAPYCVSVGVVCGHLTTPDGNTRTMRMNSYDLFDREYGDFIVYELIPLKENSVKYVLQKQMKKENIVPIMIKEYLK